MTDNTLTLTCNCHLWIRRGAGMFRCPVHGLVKPSPQIEITDEMIERAATVIESWIGQRLNHFARREFATEMLRAALEVPDDS